MLSIQSQTWSSILSALLNWPKNSNFFKLTVLRSDSMKRNYGRFIFTYQNNSYFQIRKALLVQKKTPKTWNFNFRLRLRKDIRTLFANHSVCNASRETEDSNSKDGNSVGGGDKLLEKKKAFLCKYQPKPSLKIGTAKRHLLHTVQKYKRAK